MNSTSHPAVPDTLRIPRQTRGVFILTSILLILFPYAVRAQFPTGSRGVFDACDFCLAAQGISPLEVGSSGLRIDVRYLSVGSLYQSGSRTANADRELETHLTQQYSLLYALDNNFTLAALVPIPRRHSERVEGRGTMVVGNQFGLGDVAFLGRLKLYVGHDIASTFILSVQGGLKLPTGRTDGRDSKDELLDAHIQLGTGSTDILAGMSGFAAIGRFAFIGNILGSLTGAGANGHQFGNSLNYDGTARYRIWPDDYDNPQFFLTLGLSGELRGHERQDGFVDPNSGGNVVYASPGVQVFLTPAFTIEFSYQQAVYHNLYGQQLGEDYRLMSGLQILF